MFFKNISQTIAKEQTRYFLWLPVLFGFGIGFYFLTDFEFSLIALSSVFCFLFALLICFRKRPVSIFLFALLMSFSGYFDIAVQTHFQAEKVSFPREKKTTYLIGRIQQTDLSLTGKTRLWLSDVHDFDRPLKGIYRVTSNVKTPFRVGQCVETVATVSKPSAPLMPNGFDFARHAFYQGISAIGYTESNVFVVDCDENHQYKSKISDDILNLRIDISSLVQKALPENEASVASAVLVGNKNLVSETLYAQYRNAGLAHFLSISGLHMGFIAAFAFFLVRFLMSLVPYFALHYSSKKVACIFAIILSFVYLLLSGMAVPATRAFLMSSLVFLGLIFDREAISLRMTSFAALLILVFQPHLLLSASFELSFAAVTAFVSFYETFKEKLSFSAHGPFKAVFVYFSGVLLTTLIATLATLPFSVYHFGTFAPYALLGNFLSAPIIAFLVMPFIFLSLVFLPFHIYLPFLKIAGFGILLLNKMTFFVSSLPMANMKVSNISLLSLVLITFGALWLMLWQKSWRKFGLVLIFIGILPCFFDHQPDILYSSDGKTIGIRSPQNELVVFSKKKNSFLTQIFSEGYKGVQTYQKLQSMPEISLICNQEKCTYQNIFTFDLEGNLSFNHKPLTPQKDLGGVIYLKNGKTKIQTVSATLCYNKPWNK